MSSQKIFKNIFSKFITKGDQTNKLSTKAVQIFSIDKNKKVKPDLNTICGSPQNSTLSISNLYDNKERIECGSKICKTFHFFETQKVDNYDIQKITVLMSEVRIGSKYKTNGNWIIPQLIDQEFNCGPKSVNKYKDKLKNYIYINLDEFDRHFEDIVYYLISETNEKIKKRSNSEYFENNDYKNLLLCLILLIIISSFQKIYARENNSENDSDISASENFAKPVQLFSVNNKTLEPNWKTIDKVFKSENVGLNNIKVIVVFGLPQSGKSTLCNLLYNNGDNNQLSDQLIENKEKSISRVLSKVFEVGYGTKHKTSGIWITPEPIVQQLSNGEKVNVFIVDCMGLIGSGDNLFINQKIFSLGALMASHLIYNVKQPINENDKTFLKNFVLSTKTLLTEKHKKPFQKLFFLFRDLTNEFDFKYGSESVDDYKEYLRTDLDINLDDFSSYFDEIVYYLMPEPNQKIKKIANTEDIKFEDFGNEFVPYLNRFRNIVINPKDERIKISNSGQLLTGISMASLLRDWFECIESGKLKELPNAEKLRSDEINGEYASQVISEHNNRLDLDIKEFVKTFTVENFDQKREQIIRKNAESAQKAIQLFREISWDNGIGTKNMNDVIREKMNSEFKLFDQKVLAVKNLWSKYMSNMETFLNKSKYKLEVILKGIESQHKKQITSMVEIFDNKFQNSKQDCYGIDLKSVLIEKMNAYNKKFNFNVLLINSEVNNYINIIEKDIAGFVFFRIKSNKYIELHNKYCQTIEDQLMDQLNEESSEGNKDVIKIFRTEIENILREYYNNSRNNENCFGGVFGGGTIFGGGGATLFSVVNPLTAIAVGTVGVVGAGGYFAYRDLTKPAVKWGIQL